ncbi:MAG TPA: hypothetical protein VIY28_08615 [Pseudonocardiaceae bacterium]
MRIYAERRGRATRQVVADMLVVAWVVLVVVMARAAWVLVGRLGSSAQRFTGAGEAIRGTFEDAARSAAKVPVVGDRLAGAFGPGVGAGETLASSGRELSHAAGAFAFGTAVAIVLIGAVPVVLVWLTLRVRWVIAARSALAARAVDTDLLAFRALTRQPIRRLLSVCAEPATAWRRNERTALDRLAALELAALGLRAPSPTRD